MKLSSNPNVTDMNSYNLCPLHRIFIRDLIMLMNIGVHHHETLSAQRIRVSVEMLVNLNDQLQDKLKNTVCYDEVVERIRRLALQGHVQLIETFGKQVIAECFSDRRVQEVMVTIEKLDVYKDIASVGVTISANREKLETVGCRVPFLTQQGTQQDGAISAFLIDMDGTLLDTESIDFAATTAAVETLGYADANNIYYSLVGLAANLWEPIFVDRYGIDFPIRDFHGAYLSRRELLLRDGVNLKPGAIEFLETLKSTGLPIAIVTSSSRETALRLLKLVGIHGYFDIIVTRDDVEKSKPAPDLYLFAAKKFGLPPASCVAVEDSTPGVEAAYAAGVKVFMVPDILQPAPQTRELCAAVVSDLAGVISHLKLKEMLTGGATELWP